jgi:hypothetical protein
MLNAVVAATAIFVITFIVLRGLEWLYHHLKHTKDYSPHWGSWLFAILLALYAAVANLGRL